MEANLPERIRTFVAIFPSPEVMERLGKFQTSCQKNFSSGAISWTRPEQVHVTLNFLGNIESIRLEEFEAAIGMAARRSIPFALRCKGLGCFPTVRNPKIFWAGLTGEVKALHELKQHVDEQLKPLGIIPEDRAFHPHLTLGRIKQCHSRERQLMADIFEERTEEPYGEWTVGKIDFMRSVLSPVGSFYSILKSFNLS